jgi:pimeloyl-ACP methyl ester carboxylesterase
MKYYHDPLAIFYEVIDIHEKDDPWLIMVHGFTHNCHYFSKQVSTFQQNFRIFLTDLRGHGKSAGVPGPYGIEEYADDVFAALKDAGVEKAHYWGTHTGAAIGLVLALRHPERFTSLIFEGTFLPGFPMPKVGELINRARLIAQSRGIEAAREDWFYQADWFAYIRDHPQICRAKEQRAMISEFEGAPWLSNLIPQQVTPVSECLAHIRQPTLVYNGKYDLDDFKRAALHLKQGLPDVQCEEISEAGGFPGWENPQVVNLLVSSFLTKQAR